MDAPNDSLPSEGSAAPAQPGLLFGPNGLRAGWRLALFFAVLSGLFSIEALATRLVAHPHGVRTGITAQGALFGEGLLFALVLAASWIMARVEGRRIADYGLPREQFKAKFSIGVAIGFASISALLGAMRLAGVFHLAGMALDGAELWRYAVLWALAFLFVAFFEEFFFRGYTLFTLTTGIGFWPAALLSSFIFGCVHYGNSGETWVGALAAGLVGLLFCLLLRRTGDLWMPIGFHAAWDWGETYFYGVPDSGQTTPGHLLNARFSGPPWLSGGSVGPEGSWLCILLIVLLWIIAAACLRERKYPNPAAIAGSPRPAPPVAKFPPLDTLEGPNPG
jgi:membrane protease YdiL (CAAX protease family)